MLMSKPDKNITWNENYRIMFLMNIEAKVFKISANPTHQHIQRNYTKEDKVGLTSENVLI